MQKVIKFLEKYVEWVAIALGGVYLIWMVYSYVLNSTSIDVPVGGQQMSPGKVDDYVLNNVAQPLANKIKDAKPVPINVPNFNGIVDLNAPEPKELALNWSAGETKGPQIPDQTLTPNPNNPNQPPGPVETNKVVELPKPPAPTDLATTMGRSSVIEPPQQVNTNYLQQVAAVNQQPGGAQPQPPQQQPQQPVQVQMVNGHAVDANGQPITGTDIDWVTVAYKINIQDLANEFARCKVPPSQQGQSDTCFLDVQLVRQEQLPSGGWGNETVIPKLSTSDQPPLPAQATTQPTDPNARPIMQAYLSWALSSMATLIHPTFYQYLQGDPWILPNSLTGKNVVAVNGAVVQLGPQDMRPGFDATQYITMNFQQLNAVTPPLTQLERQKIFAAREAKRQADAQARAKSHPQTPQRNNFGGAGAPEDGAPPVSNPPPTPRPAAPPAVGNAGQGPAVDVGDQGNPAQPQTPQQQNYAAMFPLPAQGDFDPRTLNNPQGNPQGQPMTIVGWAHDATAQPGKTYRYAVRYMIKNPVWMTFNTTSPQALANIFALVSPNSDWTQPVTVPPVVRFYFTSASPGNTMPVEVFRWQDGVYHKDTVYVSPGDSIGKTKGNVDFATNFTVVDIRANARGEAVAWLLNPDGQLVSRDCKADSNSPDLIQMNKLYDLQQQQLQQQQPNGQPAAGQAVGSAVNPGRVDQAR